jgi:hypothetical protein
MISSLRTLLCTLLFTLVVLAMSATAQSQVSISVAFGPPALPVYEQPVCPGDGYIWTPGYWAWDADGDDYYWVPGTWVLAPEIGFLWTPPWWGWSDGVFLFHEGWWGPHVGFYGGIVYGFGYFGSGFEGGRWDHDHFFYNRSVTNINVVNIHNVYNETVVNRYTENHISYNGGAGGIEARPRPEEEMAARERHIPPARPQIDHEQAARGNRDLHASANHGRPPIAATARPGEFRGGSVVPAREAGAPYNPPANRGGNPSRGENNASRPAVHPKELPAYQRPAAPNTGNPNRDKKYQQQQDKMVAKQQQERQNLQQKQEQEHQRLQQQNANQARVQQTEQRHQQQTEQLQQKHVQQQQRMQQKQQPPPPRKK